MRVGIDRLEFRYRNALTDGRADGHRPGVRIGASAIRECLEALRPHRERALAGAAEANAARSSTRRGVGLAGMWYGCGNTALANPSTIKVGLRSDGRVALFQGAIDMGQGANTVMTQICADALGVDMSRIATLGADTDTTPDAGKSSASRQTFVSGNATFLAASALRERLLALAGASDEAHLELDDSPPGRARSRGDDDRGPRPPWTPTPTASWRSRARPTTRPRRPWTRTGRAIRTRSSDTARTWPSSTSISSSARCGLRRITAAHDVGRAVNPTLVEGQIEGGVAQGIGMALMEEYVPGRNENLHDYLIPTIGDVPEVVSILVESGDPAGPYGAKGIGEHTLIPTAPAILNAIRDAVGAGVRRLPATPDRVLAAIAAGRESEQAMTSEPASDTVVCDACPIRCVIKPGRTGSCDRYGNVDGVLARLDPLLVLERTQEQGGALVPFAAREADWEGELVPTGDVVRDRRRVGHDVPRLQAGAVHRLVERRRASTR